MKEQENRCAKYLRTLSREALEALLLERSERDEGFGHWLDARLTASAPREAGAPLDPTPFRRRAEALFAAAGPGRQRRRWDEWGAGVDEAALKQLIDEATPFLAAGRGADALAILKPVAEALADFWPECSGWDETLHEFFPLLDAMIAQAVLMDGVNREALDDLADALHGWQCQLAEFGADDTFSTAIVACMQGWDELGLEETLVGRGQGWPAGGGGDPLADDLMRARLAALDGMGRTEHYLNLSRAAGLTAWSKGEYTILDICRGEVEPDYDARDDGGEWLAALVPLRGDILSGDLRLFYLLWLSAAADDLLAHDMPEPLPGIGPLNAALEAAAEFFDIDRDLVEAAAVSPGEEAETPGASRVFIGGLAEEEKIDLLIHLMDGDAHLGSELRQLARAQRRGGRAPAPHGRRIACEGAGNRRSSRTRRSRAAIGRGTPQGRRGGKGASRPSRCTETQGREHLG